MPLLRLGKLADVPEGRSKTFVAHGKKILVTNLGGTLVAYDNFCPHMGGALRYDGRKIVCAWHGGCFNAASGEGIANIAEGSVLTKLTVVVQGEDIMFDTDSIPRSPWANDF